MVQETLRGVALLDEDPELAAGLAGAELEQARRLLIVPALVREAGEWDVAADAPEPSLGLLLLDGLVTVNVLLGDRVASYLAGPGDVLHSTGAPEAVLPAAVTHHVSDRATAAVLDARFIAAVRRWPALLLGLHERLRMQERRLAVHAAIGKLRRVDDRVLAVLWHLAERWGRVTADGVTVPLSLTHETLGRLAGAERPTVTLALGELARTGDVVRRDDGGFVLRRDSERQLAATPRGRSRPRGLAVTRTADAPRLPDPAPMRPPSIDVALLHRRIAALREELPHRLRGVEDVLDAARATADRSARTRARLEQERRARATAG